MVDSQSDLPFFLMEDLKFSPSNSTAVVSEAHKFILPVPNLGEQAEPLVYPPEHPDAGQPILDYKGRPIGERGLVFLNEEDLAWQAVPDDGNGVIIINEVTPEQAIQLDKEVRSLSSTLSDLTIDRLKALLTYARESLGLIDFYNSTRDYVQAKLAPVFPEMPISETLSSPNTELERAYGFKRRDGNDVYQALYISGRFSFKGSANTVQHFDAGGVILEQQGKMRGIQPDIFMRTYKRLDGQVIKSMEEDVKMAQIR